MLPINIHGRLYIADDAITWPYVWLALTVIYLICKYIRYKKGIEINYLRVLVEYSFLIYLVYLINVTLLPILIFKNYDFVSFWGYGSQQIFTFKPRTTFLYSKIQLLENLIMLMPLVGFMQILYWPWRTLKNSFLLAFFVSLTIETTQAVMSYFYLNARLFDPFDLFMNTLGGVLMYYIMTYLFDKGIFNKFVDKLKPHKRKIKRQKR